MRFLFIIFFFIFFISGQTYANNATSWLKKEIDIILKAYSDGNISKKNRFDLIENTINNNFAGAGIAKFVSGDSWLKAEKDTKKTYIKLFKRHLALNIASLMKSYANQKYNLVNSKYDSKNKVSLINMEILNDTGSLFVTWRVKESKQRFFIIDLLVADISLVITKRSEFNSMLKNINYDLKELTILLEQQNHDSYNKMIN